MTRPSLDAMTFMRAAALTFFLAVAPGCVPHTPTASAEPSSRVSPASLQFLVHFAPSHPMGKAQTAQEAGQEAEASALARTALEQDRALTGLCFEGFTLGGGEVLLAVCEGSVEDAHSLRMHWLDRLASMAGVEYADSNVILQPDTSAGRS